MQPDLPGATASEYRGAGTRPIPLWDGGVRVGAHVLTRLSVSCLSYLSSHPGASGAEVRRGLGVRHLSQVSRLLGRLESKALVANVPGRRGNAWTLTAHGRQVLNEAQPVWSATVDGGTETTSMPTPIFPSIPA